MDSRCPVSPQTVAKPHGQRDGGYDGTGWQAGSIDPLACDWGGGGSHLAEFDTGDFAPFRWVRSNQPVRDGSHMEETRNHSLMSEMFYRQD